MAPPSASHEDCGVRLNYSSCDRTAALHSCPKISEIHSQNVFSPRPSSRSSHYRVYEPIHAPVETLTSCSSSILSPSSFSRPDISIKHTRAASVMTSTAAISPCTRNRAPGPQMMYNSQTQPPQCTSCHPSKVSSHPSHRLNIKDCSPEPTRHPVPHTSSVIISPPVLTPRSILNPATPTCQRTTVNDTLLTSRTIKTPRRDLPSRPSIEPKQASLGTRRSMQNTSSSSVLSPRECRMSGRFSSSREPPETMTTQRLRVPKLRNLGKREASSPGRFLQSLALASSRVTSSSAPRPVSRSPACHPAVDIFFCRPHDYAGISSPIESESAERSLRCQIWTIPCPMTDTPLSPSSTSKTEVLLRQHALSSQSLDDLPILLRSIPVMPQTLLVVEFYRDSPESAFVGRFYLPATLLTLVANQDLCVSSTRHTCLNSLFRVASYNSVVLEVPLTFCGPDHPVPATEDEAEEALYKMAQQAAEGLQHPGPIAMLRLNSATSMSHLAPLSSRRSPINNNTPREETFPRFDLHEEDYISEECCPHRRPVPYTRTSEHDPIEDDSLKPFLPNRHPYTDDQNVESDGSILHLPYNADTPSHQLFAADKPTVCVICKRTSTLPWHSNFQQCHDHSSANPSPRIVTTKTTTDGGGNHFKHHCHRYLSGSSSVNNSHEKEFDQEHGAMRYNTGSFLKECCNPQLPKPPVVKHQPKQTQRPTVRRCAVPRLPLKQCSPEGPDRFALDSRSSSNYTPLLSTELKVNAPSCTVRCSHGNGTRHSRSATTSLPPLSLYDVSYSGHLLPPTTHRKKKKASAHVTRSRRTQPSEDNFSPVFDPENPLTRPCSGHHEALTCPLPLHNSEVPIVWYKTKNLDNPTPGKDETQRQHAGLSNALNCQHNDVDSLDYSVATPTSCSAPVAVSQRKSPFVSPSSSRNTSTPNAGALYVPEGRNNASVLAEKRNLTTCLNPPFFGRQLGPVERHGSCLCYSCRGQHRQYRQQHCADGCPRVACCAPLPLLSERYIGCSNEGCRCLCGPGILSCPKRLHKESGHTLGHFLSMMVSAMLWFIVVGCPLKQLGLFLCWICHHMEKVLLAIKFF